MRGTVGGVMSRSAGAVAGLSVRVLRRQVRALRLLETQSLAVLELQRATITTMTDAVIGWQQLQIDRLASTGSDR